MKDENAVEIQKDFPELAGKEIHYFIPENEIFSDFDCTAIVVGAEYDVGITLVAKDDPNIKLFCLNKIELENDPDFSEKKYKIIFYLTIEAIEKGEVEALKIPEMFEDNIWAAEQSSCVFE